MVKFYLTGGMIESAWSDEYVIRNFASEVCDPAIQDRMKWIEDHDINCVVSRGKEEVHKHNNDFFFICPATIHITLDDAHAVEYRLIFGDEPIPKS